MGRRHFDRALNSAIIAGNPPEKRVQQLRAFWETVSAPPFALPTIPGLNIHGEYMHAAVNQMRSLGILLGGAPGFFAPRMPPPFLHPPGSAEALSFYDVAPLKATLERLGACLLNPGEMGFEPLKPVGEPDAANSRIRFDVRVEALRPSFVAPFPRWRSSAGCECGKGRGPPLGELQDIVGEADEAPLVGDLLDAAQEKLTEAARLLDLSEHRLGQLLS